MTARPRVAVVGAGAAGVSAAFWLRRSGAEVTVYEAGDRVGGRCRTIVRDGYRFDVGAGALPSTGKALLRLVDALGVSDEVVRRGAVIGALRDGEVHRIARRNPLTFLRAAHIPAGDKASLWRFGVDLGRRYTSINPEDLGTAAQYDSESVHEYCSRRFPDSIRDNLLEPMTRALLLVEPEQTSALDLFASCKALLVAGHILTHPESVGFFLDRAAGHLRVEFGAKVSGITESGSGVDLTVTDQDGARVEHVDAVVLAVPAAEAVAAWPGLDEARRDYLSNLEYSTCTVVSLGLERAPAESSSLVLVPRDIDPDLPVAALGHNLAPGRTPPGGGIVTVFWMTDWSRRHADDPDETIAKETIERLGRLFPSWDLTVRTSVVTRWQEAVVASRVGTYVGVRDVNRRGAADGRIQLAGDYHAQTSVNASVAAGERVARRLGEVLHLGAR